MDGGGAASEGNGAGGGASIMLSASEMRAGRGCEEAIKGEPAELEA